MNWKTLFFLIFALLTMKTLDDFLRPYAALSPLPVDDPEFHLILAVMNPATFRIDRPMSDNNFADFKSRLVSLENRGRLMSVHGLFLAGSNHPPDKSLHEFKNTNVKMDVLRDLKKYLTLYPDRVRELHTSWVDLYSWKPDGFSRPISMAEVFRFEFIINEYLVHGIPMGIRIGRYIDIVLNAFTHIKADKVLKNNFIGDFEMRSAFLDIGNVKHFTDVQIQQAFTSSSPPFPSGMRFRCTDGDFCCWSELRYSLRSNYQFINAGKFGYSCNISSHTNHPKVVMMTFKDRLALRQKRYNKR